MSYAEKHAVALTTDGSGDVTAYTPAVTGQIAALIYTKTDFADGVDFTITLEESGETVWTETDVNAAKTVAPRQASHSTAGVAALYAAAGEAVLVPIHAANDRVKIVVASGGAVKTGTITVIVA